LRATWKYKQEFKVLFHVLLERQNLYFNLTYNTNNLNVK
jgi:hypothetical protein